jgi:hypothetical protein
MLSAKELANIAIRDLRPLFAADASVGPQNRHYKLGGQTAPNKMWISIPGGLEVTLKRSLRLSTWEADLLAPYGKALSDLASIPDAVARNAADDVALRAIAAQVGGPSSPVVEVAIRFLLRCASSTYEGQPINLSILFDVNEQGAVTLADIEAFEANDWYAMLGSGLETGIIVNSQGGVIRIHDVRADRLLDDPAGSALRPDVFRLVGDWSLQDGRIALSLSRSRELLIHQRGRLRYIFRSGRWRSLPLDVAIGSGWAACAGISKDLKRAVLATAIDASLGHHGACIAVVVRGQKQALLGANIIEPRDQWPTNVRSRLFEAHTFQQLTRRQLLEILSMDGATIIDHLGQVLAAGAIVAVPSGSSGGGRRAAARALAGYGAAMKISQDGPISLFGRDNAGAVHQKMTLA